METARVDIRYRPFRVGWVLHSGDIGAFRQAVSWSSVLAGGRFNPIISADRPEADSLVKRFSVDCLVPLGDQPPIAELIARHPHLRQSFRDGQVFTRYGAKTTCRLLDVRSLLAHAQRQPGWSPDIDDFRLFTWAPDDPLGDVFRMELGAPPAAEDVGADYAAALSAALAPHRLMQEPILADRALPIDILDHNGFAELAGMWVTPQWPTGHPGVLHQGFFVGDADRLDDLLAFWNLRAAGAQIAFYARGLEHRYEHFHDVRLSRLLAALAALPDPRRRPAIWTAHTCDDATIRRVMGPNSGPVYPVGPEIWRDPSVVPPPMILGRESSLGVIGRRGENPSVTFGLQDQPYSNAGDGPSQELIASVRIGAMFAPWEETHTFNLPAVPELNRFFSRAVATLPDRLRLEADRVGVTITAVTDDVTLTAVPNVEIAKAIFERVDLRATIGSAGLLTRQLLVQMGGADGCRAFKIPGVRRLIRQHGPLQSFDRKLALKLIGGRDPERPDYTFDDFEDLRLEPGPRRGPLTPPQVFEHLVTKRLFRIGFDLTCPTCSLASWAALDDLRQGMTCELCGAGFDATSQLVSGEFRYRRSGVLGRERNVQGAIPVALLLQQLEANLRLGGLEEGILLPSLELTPTDGGAACETDFVAIMRPLQGGRPEICIGECKDAGGEVDAEDLAKLGAVADRLAADGYGAYILLAKLADFTAAELAHASAASDRHPIILLSHRQLEPWSIYEKTEGLPADQYGFSLAALAEGTRALYPGMFADPRLA